MQLLAEGLRVAGQANIRKVNIFICILFFSSFFSLCWLTSANNNNMTVKLSARLKINSWFIFFYIPMKCVLPICLQSKV